MYYFLIGTPTYFNLINPSLFLYVALSMDYLRIYFEDTDLPSLQGNMILS
jgi:hypothetical protein